MLIMSVEVVLLISVCISALIYFFRS